MHSAKGSASSIAQAISVTSTGLLVGGSSKRPPTGSCSGWSGFECTTSVNMTAWRCVRSASSFWPVSGPQTSSKNQHVALLQIRITASQRDAGSPFRKTAFPCAPGVEKYLLVRLKKRCGMHGLEHFGPMREGLRVGQGIGWRRNA